MKNFNLLRLFLFLSVLFFFWAPAAFAGRWIQSTTLDGAASVTVSASATITAVVEVRVTGNNERNLWHSTRWTIGSETGCVDHANYNKTTETETFTVTAPASAGTYDAEFVVYGTDDCSGISTTETMNNAVTVTAASPNQLLLYHFDEIIWDGTSGEVEDSSGNNRDASSVAGPSTSAVSAAVSGNPGTCRYGSFDGNGEYLEDPDADQYLDGLTAVTVMAWVRNTDAVGHDRGIFTTGAPDGQDNRFALRYDASGAGSGNNNLLKASINTDQCSDNGDCLQVETKSNLQTQDTWQHIAMTWQSGDKIRIFINGTEVQTTVTSSGIGVHNGALDGIDFLRIGQGTKSGSPSPEWQGDIDEFQIYDQALDATAIGQIMNGTHSCTIPLAEYRFEGCDWTTGTNVTDELGNYPGTVVQGAHTAPGVNYGGGLCNVANLQNDGSDFNRHISLVGNPISLNSDWTLMMWINFPPIFTQHFQAGGYRYSVLSGGTNDLAWIRQSNSDGSREWGTSSNPSAHRAAFPSNLTGWHHLTFVAQGSATDLYVDGAYYNTVNYKQTGTYTRIGTSADDAFISDTSRQNLDTQLDELKFYDGALRAGDISSFYNLESSGFRWDGTPLNCQYCASVDHIRIEHTGSGLTCQRSDIVLRACADAACSSESTDAVTVTMTPATASPPEWIAGDSYTFTGHQTVQLRQTTPGPVTLGISNPNPVPTNGFTCYDSGTSGDCSIDFYESGFIYTVPDLTACQTSANIDIQAVRADATAEACIADAGFAGSTKVVNFWTDYVTPNNGTEQVSLSGTDIATASPGTGLSLDFDGTATASFTVNYPDVGQVQLNARYEGIVSSEEEALVVLGNDSFISRPVGLCVESTDANADCASGDGSCSELIPVDQSFNLTVKAVCWEANGDSDFCSGNATTPNYQQNGIPITHSLVAPTSAGSSTGSISVNSVNIVAGDNGQHVIGNQSVSEVGVFQFSATPPDYFAVALPVATSANIGRFTPDHFETAVTVNGAFADACTGFTYIGQPFGYAAGSNPEVTITATDAGGNTTVNYRDDFVKLTNPATQISMPAVTTDASNLGADGTNLLDLVWAPAASSLAANDDGTLTFTLGNDQFTYTRNANAKVAPVVPSDIELRLTAVTDSDGIAANDLERIISPTGIELRYGKMVIPNAYGPETLPLTLTFTTEYFNGSSFVSNTNDSCTAYTLGNFSINDGDADDLSAAETSASDTDLLNDLLVLGSGTDFELSAPSSGDSGSVGLLYDLDLAGLLWLKPVDASGTPQNPTAKATFGIYKGNERLIYMRESVQ